MLVYNEKEKTIYKTSRILENEIEIYEMPNFAFDEWNDSLKKFVTDTTKKKQYLLDRAIEKIKTEQSEKIETSTFTHDGKIFSCKITSQLNYMGIKDAIDLGIANYPAKCWDIDGAESIITNETDLKTRIGKLFAVVYPIREKANTDEQSARNMTIKQLEALNDN